MNFTMAQLGYPGITCGHVQDEPLWPPPECPLSNTYSHTTQTTQTSRYGPQTNRPSHCLWLCRCWGGRLSSRKADKEGWLFFFSCLFSHLLQQFSVAENLGMERSTVAKRKKKCLWIMEHFKSIWFRDIFFFLASHYSQLYNMLERDLVLSRGTFCSQISTLIVATDVGG